jgi:hypothetical protein
MSKAINYDIEIQQGEDWTFTVELLNSNDEPFPLTGYSVQMDIRDAPGGNLYKSLSTTGGEIVVSGAGGSATFTLDHTETAALPFKKAVYDIFFISGADTRTPLLEGDVIVRRRVTVVA